MNKSLDKLTKDMKMFFNLKFYIFYLQIKNGYYKCKDAFDIWKNIMTNDIIDLNKTCFGLNAFDEFYASLNGGWSR